MVTLALLFRPWTTPLESSFWARKQFAISEQTNTILEAQANWSYPGAGKWQREQTADEPFRGRAGTSILFLSTLK